MSEKNVYLFCCYVDFFKFNAIFDANEIEFKTSIIQLFEV